ncbi:MAG: EI24 domain-containing protein [Burkholderiaceae bacterium]
MGKAFTMVDAAWRALLYLAMPKVLLLTLLPLLVVLLAVAALGWWGWADAVAWLDQGLQSASWSAEAVDWLNGMGMAMVAAALAPTLLLLLATPVFVVGTLLMVATTMTPSMVRQVVQRRFAHLQGFEGAGWWGSVWWSLVSTLMAVFWIVLTMPLWLLPPLAVVLPALIWGWLSYRVFAYEALAEYATADERRAVLREHRGTLWIMGLASGALGALPGLLWASAGLFVLLLPLLLPLAIWVYTLVLAYASLWFAHYALAALEAQRNQPRPWAEAELASTTPPADST